MENQEQRTKVVNGHEAGREAMNVAIDKAMKEDRDWIEAQSKGEDDTLYYFVKVLEKHLTIAMIKQCSILKTLDASYDRNGRWLASHEERLARLEKALG